MFQRFKFNIYIKIFPAKMMAKQESHVVDLRNTGVFKPGKLIKWQKILF